MGLHAGLHIMSHADVFVGVSSSNIAGLVYLMREINGLPRNSTLIVDEPSSGLPHDSVLSVEEPWWESELAVPNDHTQNIL